MANAYVFPHLHYVGDWLGPYDQPTSRFSHLERFASDWPLILSRGGIIKSHCDAALFDAWFPVAPVVYVMRDPRDTLVSFFHYLNRDELYETNPGLEDQRCSDFSMFLRRPVSEYLRFGFYAEPDFQNVAGRLAAHLSGWLRRSGVCVLRYEDLQRDFRSSVFRACAKVGMLPRLKMHPVGIRDAVSVLPRKGTSGDWKNHFRPGDEEFLENELQSRGLSLDQWEQEPAVTP